MSEFTMRAALACAALLIAATAASAQPYDHLKCFKFRDVQTFDSATADLETIEAAFPTQNCEIKKKAKHFCVPTSKDVTSIDAGTDTPFGAQELVFEQVCYKVKCPNVTIADQQISDQFGTRTVGRFKASLLCVPAVIGPPPTTSTTTTSTTTTTTTTTSTTLPVAPWSLRAGDGSDQSAIDVALDSAGNVIVLGYFAGQIDFGLGALTSAGGTDIFLVKLDPTGAAIWNKQFGNADSQIALGLAVDSLDNIVISGAFLGSVDFGGGALASLGLFDGYVAKFDPAGSHLWSKRYGDASTDFTYFLAVTSTDDIVFAGFFLSASIDLGGGPIARVGTQDGYLARLDPAGAHVWSQGYGAVGATVQLSGAAVDSSDNVLATGAMSGTVDFGGGALMSAGGSDVVMFKRSGAGAHIWSTRFGDASDQSGVTIACDAADNVLLTGTVEGTTDFGGGGLTEAGMVDIFLAKFDPAGSHTWSQLYGDAAEQTGVRVAADSSGNVLAAGRGEGVMNFGGGNLGGAGGTDAYIAKLAPAGTHVSSQVFADAGDQQAFDIVADASGHRYVVGDFAGTVDFGNGPLMSSGGQDVFVVKIAP